MRRLIYFIGVPGVGKSTFVSRLTQNWDSSMWSKPFARIEYHDRSGHHVATQLGSPHDFYPGTDRLSMGVLPVAVEWARAATVPLLLAEGDRLATRKFLDPVSETRETVLIRLVAAPEVVDARRAARGSRQAETWLKGRETKVHNLYTLWPGEKHLVDLCPGNDEIALRFMDRYVNG
jgi:hypothetical protein